MSTAALASRGDVSRRAGATARADFEAELERHEKSLESAEEEVKRTSSGARDVALAVSAAVGGFGAAAAAAAAGPARRRRPSPKPDAKPAVAPSARRPARRGATRRAPDRYYTAI